MHYNFVAESIHTKKTFMADFLQLNCNFRRKRPFCIFESPFGKRLRGNVRCSS